MSIWGAWYLPKEKRAEQVGMMGHFGWMLENIPESEEIDQFQKIDGEYYLDWMIKRGYARIKYAWTNDWNCLEARRGDMLTVFRAATELNPKSGFGPWILEPFDFRKPRNRLPEVRLQPEDIDYYIRTGRVKRKIGA